MDSKKKAEQIMASLMERAKELNCLYRVDEILTQPGAPIHEILTELIQSLPPGWQYSDVCGSMIYIMGRFSAPASYVETPWRQTADIVSEGEKVGELCVYYTEKRPNADEGPFLKEERRLITAIANHISFFLTQRSLRNEHATLANVIESVSERDGTRPPWHVLLEFLRRTDRNLFDRITRKMINHLCWSGISEAEGLLPGDEELSEALRLSSGDENRPLSKRSLAVSKDLSEETFKLAARFLSENEIVGHIHAWINEHKSIFLIKSLENPGTGLAEIADAVERYQSAGIDESDLPISVQMTLSVALLRRFFVDELGFINIAKKFVKVTDFYDLVSHLVYPAKSQGKLGGKGAGLFLATQVLASCPPSSHPFETLRIPKTWYVASDTILEFIHYNNLEEVYNRKYTDIERVRQEYPHVVQLFKNSRFPPDIVKALAATLDDFGETPLIVRSSSLLEDRTGSAFSGKYKSLFLANQGSKEARLAALQDAIAEVYASVFGPDPIEYRAERELLDFREEMGILIQEVVGRRIGNYFLPTFAGVAFSNNEFRWSSRIKREDGLVRMVPGLGTRAVDRTVDDYPLLFAPGQPGLRTNVTADEVRRYSPNKIDVINLKKNAFETLEIRELLRECGDEYPDVRKIISIVDGDRLRRPTLLEPDWEEDDIVVTFEGLLSDGLFVGRMKALLEVLQREIGLPVDIEFASDGENFYLVQCRAQSRSTEYAPAAIPRDIPQNSLIFSANRYISNGRVPDITHIVYVDPERYSALASHQEMRDVGHLVGKLNKALPKRQFILLGPGRWGSRGDIRLGVPVTYSEINNTAVLLEIAQQKGNYVPELSFGTHFFQDLVEAEIRYLPLYPADPEVVFNETFLRRSNNVLTDLLPGSERFAETVRVIDVPASTGGRILRVLMNADLDEAVGMLAKPYEPGTAPADEPMWREPSRPEGHWRWRMRMAERMAGHLDASLFGVKAFYVFGSTKNATAGPGSDIDLLVHDGADPEQRRLLSTWLDGWSQALAEINYLRTGYESNGLLDVHFVTDEDIARKTSYAVKIGAVTDAARPLPLGPKG